ncbi:MFS transporter [Microtetraspora sp. NBRC 13810]|uniref:MFS transporter n=1 Tax=Microtetraspora sp. NBRC 13810 TaxID=3030990 RepID=UPI0024A45D30|nr:MFS transporter [Microtetraspora sp. NBRC 13810]GLW05778.1 MFS transporter [Microtetraspora sp. NBRC 13810]
MDSSNLAEAGPRAGRREWTGLAVLALPTLLLALDLSVLYLALPQLSADLGASSTQQLWIADIYGFMIAGFLVTMGTVGDRVGRRKLLMIGACAFGVTSVLAAYSPTAETLVVTRALLGVAGATLMPSTLALISNMFKDPKQRAVAIGAWLSCFLGGTAIGPLVGGVLLEFFWWGSVFLLGVPVMVLLLVTAPILLPEYRAPEAGRLDLVSVGMSLATILPIVYGLKELAQGGLAVVPVAALAIGLLVGVAFVARQRRLSDPLVDVRLFRNRNFRAAFTVVLLGGITIGGIAMLFAQYLQLVEGMPAMTAGLWMLPHTLAMIVGSMLAPALAQQVRPAYLVAGGLVLSAIGYLLLTQVQATGGLTVTVIGMCLAYFGFAPGAVLSTDLIVGSAPPEKAGSASSLSETSGELSVALGIAVLGSVLAAVYRGQIADTLPAATPPGVAEAARDALVAVTAEAQRLPADLAGTVLESARAAFTGGLNVVGVVCAVTMALLAVLAVALLKDVRPGAESEQDAEAATPVAASEG